jgi:hypothetical protein
MRSRFDTLAPDYAVPLSVIVVLCFPSYETIAEKARCCRDMVYEAILALEATGVFSWVQRIDRVAERVKDLFGHWTNTYRIVRRRA